MPPTPLPPRRHSRSGPVDQAPAARAAGAWPVVWMVLVVALCLTGAIAAYRSYAEGVRGNTEALLASIARARATAVRAHLDERIADAWVLARREQVRGLLADMRRPGDARPSPALLAVLRDQATAYGYHNVILFGAQRQTLAQLHRDTLQASEHQALAQVLATGVAQPILLHATAEGTMRYGVVAPVHVGPDTIGPAAGALYLVLEAHARLLPLLRNGVPSASFQNVLLQLDRDTVIAIATGRAPDAGGSTTFRLPRARADQLRLPTRARDFDDVPVMRGVASVPRTPWAIVAKLDRVEAEAPIRVASRAIAATFLLLIAFAMTLVRNVGRRQRLHAAEENERLARRTLRVVQTSTDGYVVLDEHGRFVDVNDALVGIVGYSRKRLLRMSLADVKVVQQPNEVRDALARIRSGERARYITCWRHRDGHLLDLDVSATYVTEEQGGRFYSFVRDISESLAAQRRLERLNRLYALLNHVSDALFRARDRDEAFAVACRMAVRQGGLPLAWVGVADADAQTVLPVTAVGTAADFVHSIHITLDPALSSSHGPAARCFRERRTVVVGDIAHEDGTQPWHTAAHEHGLRSAAALPVLVDGEMVAALMLYDAAPDAFDAEFVSLLEEIARFLGLVLQGFETERQRAEEQERRRRSEERFRSHFEALPIATYVVHEASGQVRRVNRAFINLFGYDPHDVPSLEASFERFFADPVYRAQTFEVFRRDLADVTAGATPRRSREYTIRCRDGSERVVQAIVTRAGDELIIGWVDLTALRTSQELLGEAQRIARLGSWSYDFRRGTRELSDDTIELFDLDRAQPDADAMLAAALDPADVERLHEAFFRAVRDRVLYEITVPLHTRRGGRRHALIRARITLDDHGQPLRAVGSAQDVTEQVEAALELDRYRDQLEERVAERTEALAAANAKLAQALEEADAANRAKSAFLAVMSHEIRTPLNGVIGMAEVLAQSPLPARDADAVRIIRASATNLLGIIDDILDFSKIEAGRIELEREVTNLVEMLDGVQAALAPMADARRVDVAVFVAPDVPERIVTDATRLRQICYNLVGNAIKFSGGRADMRGRVAIRVHVAQADPLQLRIDVHDNGIGMSAETLSHLFTSFTQAELSTTRRFGGTGLGLAICRRLMDLFGGSISVRSTEGVGSSFSVLLPTAAAATGHEIVADVHGVHCLVVRDVDTPGEADDIAAYLGAAGAVVRVVETVADGRDALATAPRPVVCIVPPMGAAAAPRELVIDDGVRLVQLTEGRRRTPRVAGPHLVTIDRYHLRARSLVRSVGIAAGQASPEVPQVDAPVHAPPARRGDPLSVAQARTTGQLILVAEDDEVNQKVLLQQLALLGYAAEVARNGVEALSMLESERYALLLTDLHMPQMDGYELTRRVRAAGYEATSGRALPIIALTANALRGEEARAREFGMDGFLTKPVLLTVLKQTLAPWVLPGVVAEAPAAAAVARAGEPRPLSTLDITVLQGLIGDDEAVTKEFLADYRVSAQRLAAELRLGLTQGDLNAVAGALHKLKSSSRSVGALSLGALAHRMEQAARARDVGAVQQEATSFEAELEAVMNAISRIVP